MTRTRGIWSGMKTRCRNTKRHDYPHYGGRGIVVCERWNSFDQFLADMGECPAGMTLDRIDVDGHYEPANCRWATRHEQSRNTRSNHLITFNGETLPLCEWSSRTGIRFDTIHYRLKRGWPVGLALTAPTHTRVAA